MLKQRLKPIVSATLLALSATATQASERVIIQVDNPGKGIVKNLIRQAGGELKVEGNGFIAVQFDNKTSAKSKDYLTTHMLS